jgi:hypothetical protein
MNIVPFEQAAAEAITGLIVSAGQGGNAANITKRANTALAVAAAMTQLATGNAAPAIAAIQGILANSSMDPGVALAVQGLFQIGQQQLTLSASLGNLIPLVATTAEAVITNVAAGVTAAANAEIAKYAPKPAAQTAEAAAEKAA